MWLSSGRLEMILGGFGVYSRLIADIPVIFDKSTNHYLDVIYASNYGKIAANASINAQINSQTRINTINISV